MAKYKRRKKLQLDKFQCILLLILGLLLGTAFTFGIGYWNATIDQKDATTITAEYAGYEIKYGFRRRGMGGNRINEVDMLFADHEPLTIDGSCVTDELLSSFNTIKRGDTLQLLVHPNGGDIILSITAGNKTLLSFEDAMKSLSFERWGFFCLGLFCYIWAGIGTYYLIAKKYY